MMEIMFATSIAFCRIGTFIYLLPILSGKSIPTMAKTILGMSLSFAVADKIPIATIESTPELVFVIITQIGIAAALAKLVEILMVIPKMAGMLMDFDLGFSMAQMLDINSGSQTTILSNVLDIFFILIFISLSGLNSLMYVLVKSFDYTASIGVLVERGFVDLILTTLLFAITSAVQVALPIMGTAFILNMILMLMAKNAPQLQIFTSAFAVKMTVGLLFFGTSIVVYSNIFQHLTNELLEQYAQMFDYFLKKP